MAVSFTTLRYKNLSNWSVAHLLANQFNYNEDFKLERIGNFLYRNKTQITVEDETVYKRVTIRLYNKGVRLRDTEIGRKIGTKKQYLIKEGQFLMSKIDARNGAFGIATNEVDGAIITADFFAYDIDETKIIPQFLVLLTTTNQFMSYAQSASSGTTGRQRIDEKKFLDVKIPLPSLNRQKEILHQYNKRVERVLKKKLEIKLKEKQIDDYILSSLGVRYSNSSESNLLTFTRLKDLTNWSVKDLKSSNQIKSDKYSVQTLSNVVIGKPQYGSNSKAVKEITDVRYIRITDINEDGSLNDKIVSSSNVNSKYLLKQDDFLIARSGTVGLTFLYDEKMGKSIYAGYLIRFHLDKSLIIPRYLFYYTKSSLYKSWVESTKRVTGVPNINAQEYLNSPLILPSINNQKIIVDFVDNIKSEINNLLLGIEENTTSAKEEFENQIFK
ncbi:restriction endonuclease subunit S [Elizabethkingia anophelis]|nr:restriction endonuclease subunit S [Elizabethkingia anophelis]